MAVAVYNVYGTFHSFSSALFSCLKLLSNWNAMSVNTPVYFISYCYVLTQVLGEMKNQLLKKNKNLQLFYAVYNEICDLIIYINDLFHTMLSLAFTLLLEWVYYDAYLLIFTSIVHKLGLLFLYLTTFIRVVLMCWFSSSVAKISEEVKNLVFCIPGDVTPFIFNIQNRSSKFTILDAIVIDKNLIVTFVGSLVTYGILLATFTVKPTNET